MLRVEEQWLSRMYDCDAVYGHSVLNRQHTRCRLVLLIRMESPYPAFSDTVRPDKGGIHPREAADHHKDIANPLFQTSLLEEYELSPS